MVSTFIANRDRGHVVWHTKLILEASSEARWPFVV